LRQKLFSKEKNKNFFAGNFVQLVEYLNDSHELLVRNLNLLDNVLETLDLQQHSLGALYIVNAKISEIQVCLFVVQKDFFNQFK
jgi:c-di-GMP-related signal transduction protein